MGAKLWDAATFGEVENMEAATNRGPKAIWAVTLSAGLAMAVATPWFFRSIGSRVGSEPWEPFMGQLPAVDLSIPIFLLLYGGIIACVALLLHRREAVLRVIQAFIILTALRMISMAIVALSPPPGIIPLIDPVSQLFYPSRSPFLHDLFFSGHTATLFLMYLAWPFDRTRWILLASTLFVGTALVVQHVHWTVDVVAAPFAAWCAWKLAGVLQRMGWNDPVRRVRG
jgi:hypothetical protein